MMAYIFGDGFDLYATGADAYSGYWDTGFTATLVPGRFAGQALSLAGSNTLYLAKASGSNDPVHHIICAYRQTAALVTTGVRNANVLTLQDGATAQCSIVFRSDGTILLTSGMPVGATTGTVLATWGTPGTNGGSNPIAVANTWYAFEFEVVIHPTAGSFTARLNGSSTNTFGPITGLATRGGTANSYANRLLMFQAQTVSSCQFDDFLWRSDVTAPPWLGDIRCYVRSPASDVQALFTRSTAAQNAVSGTTALTAKAAGAPSYFPFNAGFNGTLGSATVSFNVTTGGGTGHVKCAIYSDAAGAPGALLATSSEILNPLPLTSQTVTFASPPTLVKGTQYWFGYNQDASMIFAGSTAVAGGLSATQAYASWPTSNPTGTSASAQQASVIATFNPATNADCVNQAVENSGLSYLTDGNTGDADFYTLGAMTGTPASIIAVTTRGFVGKTDAGSRTGAMQLKSAGTTVATPTTALTTVYGWAWRTDTTDPATGAAWAPAGVNNLQIGPVVLS
jgi:hypothetical protein